MQKHGLSGYRLELLKDLDAVLDRDAALPPPRRDDLDDDVAHLPSLDVSEEALEDSGLGALGVHLDERDVPTVEAKNENDANPRHAGLGFLFSTTEKSPWIYRHAGLGEPRPLQNLARPIIPDLKKVRSSWNLSEPRSAEGRFSFHPKSFQRSPRDWNPGGDLPDCSIEAEMQSYRKASITFFLTEDSKT